MINAENQCCTYEQAIKFKNAGVVNDVLFFWIYNDEDKLQFFVREKAIELFCTEIVNAKKEEAGIKDGQWFEYDKEKVIKVAEEALIELLPSTENDFLFPAYTVAELGAMLLKETKDCHFHNPSGCWAHYHTMWDKQNQQDLFSTQAECYADLLLYYMHKYPAKFNANTLNARLQKFYDLKRIA